MIAPYLLIRIGNEVKAIVPHSQTPIISTTSPNTNPRPHSPLKFLTPDRHLQTVERILHDKVGIQLMALPQRLSNLPFSLHRVRKQQELDPRDGLVAAHGEAGSLEAFDARGEGVEGGALLGVDADGGGCSSGRRSRSGLAGGIVTRMDGSWTESARDCVDAVEGACEVEKVVYGEWLEGGGGGVEGSVVD